MARLRLWIAVHLPRLAIEAFFRRHMGDPGCVIVEGDRVVAMSAAAAAAGVRIGMRRGGALMLLPEVVIVERDPTREQECENAVAMALLQYTPQVALTEESVLLMDVGASLTLFRGPRALCRRIRADLRAFGITGHLGSAPTARGAWLLARYGRGLRRTLGMSSMSRRLEQLPASVVPLCRPFEAWFDGIGCSTIGDLRRLPRPGLQRRCGRALLDFLDAAYGSACEMHAWFEPPEAFRAQIEIFDRVEKADELLAGAHGLVLQMLGWLCTRRLAVRRLQLQMIHERGRVARPPTTLEIALADAVWRDDHIVRLLKEKLARQTLEAPVIGLALEVCEVVPMAAPTLSLFPDPNAKETDQQQLFEVLAARLGTENVLRPQPTADHRPDVANTWTHASSWTGAAALAVSLPPDGVPLPRPTWLLAEPIRLLMRDNRPFYASPLRLVSSPERIEAGWWSGTQTRDYFIAEGTDHTLYWVYRERGLTADGEPEPKWFLHGLFG